jgi:hypothetical protein
MDPILKIIADNPALFDALLKHISEEFGALPIGIDTNKTNEELGEIVRARLQGSEKVREAFKKILQLKSTSEQPIKRNEAR